MTYDLIVRDAVIVDGTGRRAYGGDVAIDQGRIAEVGEVDGSARRTIEADGLAVAPGFIDAHTHYDAQLLWDSIADPCAVHGVTTILLGNCGYSLAPVRPADQDYLMGLFAAVEEVPKAALTSFAPLGWESFGEYVAWLPNRLGLNALTQVGHSTLRRYVMGPAALERAATDDEIALMVRIVEGAMEAGAVGFSSSQAPHQRGEHGEHVPSYFAAEDELVALATAVCRAGKRLVSLNPASKREGLSAVDRALLARLAAIPGAVVSWNDFGMGTPDWSSALEFMEAELLGGHEVYAVARCQRPETRFTFTKLSALFAGSEAWVDFSRLDEPAKLAALRDPAWRARLAEFWSHARFMAMTSVEKAGSTATAPLEGRLVSDIAAERGVSAPEAMFDVAIQDELRTYFRISGPVNVDESALERILKSPATLVGVSDGGAHLQSFVGGDYPSYFLAHWVRETGSYSLEDGVAALTSRVATFLGLDDRGTLEVGKAADLVLFDPETVGPLTLQSVDDIPGGGARLTKGARSIPWVVVNGEPVLERGEPTGAVPGRVLKTTSSREVSRP